MKKLRRFKRFESLPHGIQEAELIWDEGKHVRMIQRTELINPDDYRSGTKTSYYYETTSGVFLKTNNWARGGLEPVTEFAQLEAEAAELRITDVLAGKVSVIQPSSISSTGEPLTEKQKGLDEIQEHFDKIQADFAEKEKRYQDRIKEIAVAETKELKLERLAKVRVILTKR